MKKAKVILLSVVIVLIFLLCACQQVSKQLEAPQDIIVSEDNIIHWRTVDGASSYIVIIDGIEQPKTLNTQFDLNTLNLSVGQEVVVKVKAIGDGYMYLNSADSIGVKYVIKTVQTPSKPDNSGNEASNNNQNNSSNDESNNSNTQTNIPTRKCSTEQIENLSSETNHTMFKDEKYHYYIFHIGTIFNVALQSSANDPYYGNGDEVLSFQMQKTEATQLKESASEVVETFRQNEYSLEESFKYSKSKSSNIGLDLGILSKGMGLSRQFELGLVATQKWTTSTTTTISKSFENCITKESQEVRVLTKTLSKDSAHGNYIYALFANLEVYKAVVVDTENNEYDVFTFSEVAQSIWDYDYIGEQNRYSNTPNEELTFDIADVKDILLISPETDISIKDQHIEGTLKSCARDNGYDYRTPANATHSTRHNGFEMGELKLLGAQKLGDVYFVNSQDDIKLSYYILQNPNELPKAGDTDRYKIGTPKIEDDTYSGKIYGVGEGGIKVGYGLCLVKCIYEENADNTTITENIFKNKNDKDFVDINLELKEGLTLKEIQVTIVYEIHADALNWIGTKMADEWTDWRCDYTIKIKSN